MFKQFFYFDIETVGNYKDFKALTENQKEYSLFMKKYESMSNWKEYSPEEAYNKKSGLHSTFGKIVCISFGYFTNNGLFQINSFSSDNEIEILEQFNSLLKKVEKKGLTLCGYNILSFDIPWISHKLNKYDIDIADIIKIYGKKPWELKIIDLADEWKGKFSYHSSFDEVVYELNLESPKSDISGSQVHQIYWKEHDLNRISKYCNKDVEATKNVAMKMFS
jgi:hypothetical protein